MVNHCSPKAVLGVRFPLRPPFFDVNSILLYNLNRKNYFFSVSRKLVENSIIVDQIVNTEFFLQKGKISLLNSILLFE